MSLDQAHLNSIQANTAAFTESFAKEYDERESMQSLSLIFAKVVLELDVTAARKTPTQSAKVIGDPSQWLNGFDKLPSVEDHRKKFPHSLIKPGIKLMDFACGTGMFTEKLFPYLKGEQSEVTGIDISEPFLNAFNKRADASRGPDLDVSSYCYDILDPHLVTELDAKFSAKFDVIVSTIAYHHIHEYREATKKLATFLKPGGWLLILDFYNEDVERPTVTSSAVSHMGGLKIDNLNQTLGEHSGLINVSSAREFRTELWQDEAFIKNHLPEEQVEKITSGQLKTKVDTNGKTLYSVAVSFILSFGQQPQRH